MYDAKQFWSNIDACNPYKSIGELIRAGGMNYHRITQQRVDGTIPKAEDLLKLSGAIHKSIEFLLTGEDFSVYSPRVEAIARRCEFTATEKELFIIETVLGLNSSSTVIDKDELESLTMKARGKKPSSGHIA